MVGNNTLNRVDYLGLEWVEVCEDGYTYDITQMWNREGDLEGEVWSNFQPAVRCYRVWIPKPKNDDSGNDTGSGGGGVGGNGNGSPNNTDNSPKKEDDTTMEEESECGSAQGAEKSKKIRSHGLGIGVTVGEHMYAHGELNFGFKWPIESDDTYGEPRIFMHVQGALLFGAGPALSGGPQYTSGWSEETDSEFKEWFKPSRALKTEGGFGAPVTIAGSVDVDHNLDISVSAFRLGPGAAGYLATGPAVNFTFTGPTLSELEEMTDPDGHVERYGAGIYGPCQ